MKIQEALKKYHKIEIELLLSHVLGKSREFVFMNPEAKLTSKQVSKLASLVNRRISGEPMAYILGYKDFYGLRFKVNKNVLIPRPETEMVVDKVSAVIPSLKRRGAEAAEAGWLESIQSNNSNPSVTLRATPCLKKGRTLHADLVKILDVGTGSGCIAISIAKKLKTENSKLKIFASDISPAALKVAKQNAKSILGEHYDTSMYHSVNFIKSDLLKNIKFDPDIIIANLPYGWHGVKNRFSSVKDGLKFEPQGALYTKENGLYEIRCLLEQVAQKKHQPKQIYLEFDPRHKSDLGKLIKKKLPKTKVEFLKDFRNLWRYAIISIK